MHHTSIGWNSSTFTSISGMWTELEGLVVWYLFEMSKANLSGTGYKMCKYNKLAPLQDPPHPVLDYFEVVEYSSLGEFSLLKHSCHHILTKPWLLSANHMKRLSILDTIDSPLTNDPESLLVAELKEFYAKRHHINIDHYKHLQKMYVLEGYTSEWLQMIVHSTVLDEDKDDGEDDKVNEEEVRLEDLVLHLTL
ncbi:hypothetical protein DFH29DRAFT_985458 [Suillus ampliporus]|nr:hypothetical protein DFH29DRAFT_985458 [Suillus ampliporus]